MKRYSKILYAILSFSLGLFLVWLIVRLTPISIEQVLSDLQDLNIIYVCLVVIATFIHLWLTAYKWKLITQKLTLNQKKTQRFYLYYIVFANLLAQILPQQLGLTFVQGLALKLHKVSSFSQGFFSVIYDQIFNLLIPILLLPPSILLFTNQISLPLAIFLSLGTLLIAHCLIIKWHKPLLLAAFKGYCQVKKKVLSNKKQIDLNLVNDKIPIFATSFTTYLFWLSALRHGNWILRSYLVVLAGGFAIKFWAIAFTTNLVQTAMLVSITPANLGFMEWSWIGGLELLGIPAVEAGSFAFLQRILGVFSIILIALCCWLSLIASNLLVLNKFKK